MRPNTINPQPTKMNALVRFFQNIRSRLNAPRRFYVKVILVEKQTSSRFGPAVFTVNAKSKAEAKQKVRDNLSIVIDDCWSSKEKVNGSKQ